MRGVFSLVAAATVVATQAEKVQPVFEQEPVAGADAAFDKVYESFLAEFPAESHALLMQQINDGLSSYLQSQAFVGAPEGPQCDSAPGSAANLPSKMSAFPGGITKRLFGMDLAKLVDKLASKASGAAGAQGVLPGILAMQGISTGAGLVKAGMSTVLSIVPRVIPPTGFMPLQCMPMVTGHNCFGAIQYPITAADFVTADTTDAQLDGVIAGFPSLYKRKVGTTSDAAYKACFSAYMGMHCSSLFPRCNVPKAGQEPAPTGRLPMCFTHCLATLVMCPGMWVDDIMGECTNVSVPPMCSMSVFANYWLLPPQYKSFEDSLPSAATCPTVPSSLAGFEGSSSVYEDSSIMASPYGGAVKLPTA